MPIYSYLCESCGAAVDEYRTIEKRNNCPTCSLCKTEMVKTVSSYAVVGDLEPYYDDNLQTTIKSKQHRKEVMREQGVYEIYGKNWHTGANTKTKRRV